MEMAATDGCLSSHHLFLHHLHMESLVSTAHQLIKETINLASELTFAPQFAQFNIFICSFVHAGQLRTSVSLI